MSEMEPLKLRKSYFIKLNQKFYKLLSIESLEYMVTVPLPIAGVITPLAAGATAQYDIADLSPPYTYIYWITAIGVNGLLRFQLQYPRNVIRNTPENNKVQYFDNLLAPYLDPFPISFFIHPVALQPTLGVTNPTAGALTADMWFFGYKFKVEEWTETPDTSTDLTDYTDLLT